MIWQYKVIYLGTEEVDLNHLGADGWECFAVLEPREEALKAFLKRPVEIEEQGRAGDYSYTTVENGYVVFDRNGDMIDPWELVKMLRDD